jgi:hypothetical protein
MSDPVHAVASWSCGQRALHEEPKVVGGAAQCAKPLHHASQNRCIAKSDWKPVVERIVVPVHLGEKGTFVQKLLCISHEEYFTKRSSRLKKAGG